MAEHTAAQVAKLTGTPYRTLMQWVQYGLLSPERAMAGRRVPTVWHDKDVREASVLVALRRAGFSLQRLRDAISYLRSLGQNPMSDGDFIAVRNGDGHPSELLKFCDTGEAVALLQEPGQLVLPLWTPGQEVGG